MIDWYITTKADKPFAKNLVLNRFEVQKTEALERVILATSHKGTGYFPTACFLLATAAICVLGGEILVW